MRTIALVALAISLASWTAGTTYANASWTAFEQSGAESSANTAGNSSRGLERASMTGQEERHATQRSEQRRAPGKDRARPFVSTVKDHPKRAPNSPARLRSGKAVKPERGSVSSGTTTTIVGSRVHSPLGVSPNAARPPSLANNARHRGANPAVLGGPVNSGARKTAIDGTGMRRKP
jgi:hypothetical protein